MLLRVDVALPQRQALVVPEIAIQQEGEQAYVFRVNGTGVVDKAPVKLGSRSEGQVEVVSGLKAGERIVVEGTVKLHEGSKVTEAKPAPEVKSAAATTAGGVR
jgi:membrane fusion protein (multidrug efflux system)